MVGLALLLTSCTMASKPSAAPPTTPAAAHPVYVRSPGGQGADFRRTPGPAGERIRALPDGSMLTATGKEQQVDGQSWQEVRDATGVAGWVNADSLSTTIPSLPTPTAMAAVPTPTPFLIPTVAGPTPAPAGPRPIDTLVPIGPANAPPRLAPLPPAPTARPATPTPIPVAPAAVPTLLDPESGRGLILCQDGSVSTGSGAGACAGHGGVTR